MKKIPVVIVAMTSILGAGSVVAAEQTLAERAIHVCNACHGEGGVSTSAIYPKLAGQPALYTQEQLKKFRDQGRSDSSPQGYMWGISSLLDDPTIAAIAEYYAEQKVVPGKAGSPKLMEEGRQIFEKGIPAKAIPACTQCHGQNGEGASVFPRIASQHAAYLVRQLNEFNTKLRPHGTVMKDKVVKKMSAGEMKAVAAYLQAK